MVLKLINFTGFKFIGDKIREYQGKKIFIFGYEESYGYMIKDFTRDKDGVQSTILACEICNYYHLLGKTLVDVLNEIYEKYGHVEDVQESETLPGIDGAKKWKKLLIIIALMISKSLRVEKLLQKKTINYL